MMRNILTMMTLKMTTKRNLKIGTDREEQAARIPEDEADKKDMMAVRIPKDEAEREATPVRTQEIRTDRKATLVRIQKVGTGREAVEEPAEEWQILMYMSLETDKKVS
jgi:hypothetical protein